MTDINHITIIGRLIKSLSDDERAFSYLGNGTAVANISIAVNRSKKVGDQWQDETSYFDITIFGRTAENLKPYLTKGTQIAVDGYLKQDRWEKDGQKYSRVGIIANTIQLCGSKKDSDNNSMQQNQNKFTPVNNNDADFEQIPF